MTISDFVGDSELMDLVNQVLAEEQKPGGALDPNSPSTLTPDDVKSYLRAYLFNKQYPEVKYVASVGTIALLLGGGFLLGSWWARR